MLSDFVHATRDLSIWDGVTKGSFTSYPLPFRPVPLFSSKTREPEKRREVIGLARLKRSESDFA